MGMFGGGGPPEPKGDISQLWKLLGVEMYGDEIVWQDFNPEPKLGEFLPRMDVHRRRARDGRTARRIRSIRTIAISAGMQQVLFFWPGSFRPADNSKLDFNEAGRDRPQHRHDQLPGRRR